MIDSNFSVANQVEESKVMQPSEPVDWSKVMCNIEESKKQSSAALNYSDSKALKASRFAMKEP